MNYKIAVLDGDGIGPEICRGAIEVLEKVGKKFGHTFAFTHYPIGGCAIDECGTPLPERTVEGCLASDSVLLGAVGGYKWDNMPVDVRPEKGLLGIRKAMGLYSNIRPAKLWKSLVSASPLKYDIVKDGVEIIIVRELTGGIYFGERATKETPEGLVAYDVEKYSEGEIRRIAKTAFDMAMKRNKHVTSIDKANVLDSSRLWRRIVAEVAKDYPEVKLDNMYVDNAAMQLIRNPKQFDVILTSNIFGDILSDEASQITGSIGMLPSASLADGNFGRYDPVHGSAPDIAGKNIANPLATILSVAMMLRYTLGLSDEADAIEKAVDEFLKKGYRTFDIAGGGDTPLGTRETGEKVAELVG